ncbi:MAG: glucose 1-dehydrogenase [Oscillospiraceae bacterium]
MISKRLEGKVALVTGSTSGIGRGIAKVLSLNGAKVVVTGRREEKGAVVVNEIVSAGGEAAYMYSDVTKPDTIKDLIDGVVAKYGKIDVLVNNAANVSLKDGPVEDVTIEMWDAIMESDLRSTFVATKYALPHMRANGGGSIINIGSCSAVGSEMGSAAYAAAKAGINLLTQSTATQYGKMNIRCNCIRPGLIITPENEAKVPQFLKDIFMDNISVPRQGKPEDIGNLALFFASDESSFINGQLINADGGVNSHMPTVAQIRNLSKGK